MKRPIGLCLAAVLALALILGGCAQKSDGAALVNGQWKSAKDASTVVIDLSKTPSTISYQQKKYLVSIQKIEGDRIALEVELDGGQKAVWELVKVWDDNGSSFDLDFFHDNTRERLRHS